MQLLMISSLSKDKGDDDDDKPTFLLLYKVDLNPSRWRIFNCTVDNNYIFQKLICKKKKNIVIYSIRFVMILELKNI